MVTEINVAGATFGVQRGGYLTAQYPNGAQLRELDDLLAAEGIPADRRPDEAMQRWLERHPEFISEYLHAHEWFRDQFAALHPSVNFKNKSFAYLCVSARGISYELKPPIVFGQAAIDPLKFVQIRKEEVERIFRTSPDEFWELYYQAADGIDLFMASMDFHPKNSEAAQMLSVGKDQLQASARQLVACDAEMALPQGCCLSAEMICKAVLLENGVPVERLKNEFGHKLPALFSELVRLLSGPNDKDVLHVAGKMPRYTDVRFKPPSLNMREKQGLYSKTMFLCAETLRRTRHDQLYYKVLSDPSVPARGW